MLLKKKRKKVRLSLPFVFERARHYALLNHRKSIDLVNYRLMMFIPMENCVNYVYNLEKRIGTLPETLRSREIVTDYLNEFGHLYTDDQKERIMHTFGRIREVFFETDYEEANYYAADLFRPGSLTTKDIRAYIKNVFDSVEETCSGATYTENFLIDVFHGILFPKNLVVIKKENAFNTFHSLVHEVVHLRQAYLLLNNAAQTCRPSGETVMEKVYSQIKGGRSIDNLYEEIEAYGMDYMIIGRMDFVLDFIDGKASFEDYRNFITRSIDKFYNDVRHYNKKDVFIQGGIIPNYDRKLYLK